MRKKIVAGNWKMNMTLSEGLDLAVSINEHFKNRASLKAEVILCTPYIHLSGIAAVLKDSKITFGAQNCASESSGAYTGEISSDMIKSTGAQYVIIGHSERRTYYNEYDKLLNKKTILAVRSGLKVIFCCGELLPERESDTHFKTVKRQLEDGLFNLSKEEFEKTVIAYEPVWAIGTGLTASPEQVREMHYYIRKLIGEKYGDNIANGTSVLYGGSCKPSNAAGIFALPDVDGGLIGGASLNKEDFCAIVDAI